MSEERPAVGAVCQQCGAKILTAAPEGLCPKCLVGMGLSLISTQAVVQTEKTAEPPPASGPPRRFSDYELLDEIARGGMGVVYRARQISLNRMVAVKVLLFGQFASDTFVRRFRAEAEAAASLHHPNIVAIHEIGEQNGQRYFSMELVEGRSLDALVRDRPLPARDSARYLKTIAEAVEYAHRHGVLHRDLKPSNVLIDDAGQPRVTDFGLAKRLVGTRSTASHSTPENVTDAVKRVPTEDLTLPGQVLGSPNFMPPEQAEPKRGPVTAASDVYSLGAILYHLITGRPPFLAETFEETLLQLLHHEPVAPQLLNPSVPVDLETISLKCLAKEPSRRYASAQALADELGRFLRDEPILARPAGHAEKFWRWCRRQPVLAALWGGLTVVLLAGVSGVTWQWRRAETNARDARRAESDAKEQLWHSWLEQARSERRTGEIGQRHRALEAVTRAAALRPALELRNEAIAALVLPDVRFVPVWSNHYPVSVTDFTSSQTRFAVATASGRIRMFQTSDASEEPAFPAVSGWAQRFQFSPDERFLTARYSTGSNVVWEVATRTPVMGWGASSRLTEFTSDSQRLLTVANSGVLRCLSVPDGRELWQRRVRASLWSFAVQPQQKYFAAHWRGKREVEVRDLGTGELVRTLASPSGVGILAWSPDGQRLVAGVENGWMYAWQMDSEAEPESWKGHDDAVVGLAFAPTGQWLVSSSWDSSVRLWTWPSRSLAVTARRYGLSSPRFDSDGRRLTGVMNGPIVGRFEVATSVGFRHLAVPLGEERGAWSLDVSPDGKLLAAGHTDGVRLLDLATGREVAFNPMPACISVLFTPDGSELVTCGVAGLSRWPIEKSPTEVRFGPRVSIRDGINFNYATMTGDGRWVAAANQPAACVALYEVKNPANRFALTNHPHIQHAAISPDGRWVASGTWNGSGVKIWEFATRRLVRELPVAGSARVTFSPDSRLLVSGSKRYQAWEAGTWRELYHTSDTAEVGAPAAFSPDGRIIATTRDRRAVQLLAADSGRVLAELEAPSAVPISWLRFTPDGASLVALEWTRGIQVWDLRRLRAELAARNLDWEAPPDPREK